MEISSQKSLELRQQTAAALLASAVVELFPEALLVGGQGTPDHFFYDFVFPFIFEKELLPLVEERMRLMIREKRAMRLLEMMPSNAAAMLRHRGQVLAADAVSAIRRALVTLCQIGECAVYCPLPFQEELTIPFFKLLEVFPLARSGGGVLRLIGAATETKEELKAIAKQPKISSRSHVQLAIDTRMLAPFGDEGYWIWCPEGENLRQRMVGWWTNLQLEQNFKCIATPAAFLGEGGESLTAVHREYFFLFGTPRVAEIAQVSCPGQSDPGPGLFSPAACFVDRAHLFCKEEKLLEECISSLRFILEIPKILGFEFEIVLSVSGTGSQAARNRAVSLFRKALDSVGVDYAVEKEGGGGMLASIDLRIADALGRRWTGPWLGVPEAPMPVGKGVMLVRSVFGSLERTVALLLEQKGGWLPLVLAPEQARILVVSEPSEPYARRVCRRLQDAGIRVRLDNGKETLKARLYRAMVEKVPYVILPGDREERANVLTVRAYGESEEQTVSTDEFCMRLKYEMGSKASELTN